MEFKGTKETWFKSSLEIVSMPSQVKIAKVSGANYEEAKANALLISKAPEMLYMLEIVCTELYKTDNELATKVKQLIKEASEL